MNDDEVSFRIVRLYFEEIARLGFKRQLDLDQIINAYFYVLNRLDNKEESIRKIVQKMEKEENSKTFNSKTSEEKITKEEKSANGSHKEETITKKEEVISERPKEKSITEILESN